MINKTIINERLDLYTKIIDNNIRLSIFEKTTSKIIYINSGSKNFLYSDIKNKLLDNNILNKYEYDSITLEIFDLKIN